MSEPIGGGCTVVVFAKAPLPGFAKTRLVPALGADGAARLAELLLVHAVQAAARAGVGPVELCCTPDAAHPAFAALAGQYGIALTTQGDGDLGARMSRAFERCLAHVPQVLVMGTDAPALDAALIRRAAQALEHTDAVFVPAHDGGYALVGLRSPSPSLFDNMTWSTSTVMAHTRERLAATGLRYAELPPVADIDEAADLIHLPRGWLP